jgi:hypothetical protein
MKILGIEGTLSEFKELASHISINLTLIGFVLFIFWQCRTTIFKFLQNRPLFKKKKPFEKVKCSCCKKKKFSPTYQNVSDILDPPSIVMLCLSDYRKAGDFLICNNCREVVGIWRDDGSLDQYKITEQSNWNNLVYKHKVCFSAYAIHTQWIKDIDYTDTICLIEQLPTLKMQANKINLSEIKRLITKRESPQLSASP